MKTEIKQLRLAPDVVSAVIESGAVLLDLRTKYFYSLNKSGWAIVQLFEKGASPEAVLAIFSRPAITRHDSKAVSDFIDVLRNEQLLVEDAGSDDGADLHIDAEWSPPVIEKHREPLQRIMTSAFDPSIPLAE